MFSTYSGNALCYFEQNVNAASNCHTEDLRVNQDPQNDHGCPWDVVLRSTVFPPKQSQQELTVSSLVWHCLPVLVQFQVFLVFAVWVCVGGILCLSDPSAPSSS